MALSKMKLVNIIGVFDSLDKTINTLGNSGVFQIDDAQDYFAQNSDLLPIPLTNDLANSLDKMKNIILRTGVKVDVIEPDKLENKSVDEINDYVDSLEDNILSIIDEKNKIDEEIQLTKNNIKLCSNFKNLSIDLKRLKDCEYIKVRFGRLPKESSEKIKNYPKESNLEFIPSSIEGDYLWGTYIAPIENIDDVDRIFSSLYFEECDIAVIEGTPEEFITQQNQKLNELTKKSDNLALQIDRWGEKNQKDINIYFSILCVLNVYSLIKSKTYRFRDSFVIFGWIPSEYKGQIEDKLNLIEGIDVTFTDAKDEIDHSPPIKLNNKFFFKPFEFYTEMYGLPRYNEIDPSAFIAIVYTILFGIMFADVGHGLVLTLVALFMYFKKKMPLGRLLIPCGISSAFFGLVFGSVFGFEHLLDPIYKTLFGINGKPIEVLEGKTISNIIFASIGIGIFLLIIAMILNIYSSFKRGDIGNALFGTNGFAGLVFYSSVAAGIVCQLIIGIPIMTLPYVICLIVVPLLIIFFRNPLSKLVKGDKDYFPDGIGSFISDNFFELFETILSYLTNTMSFLRVGAFVLVHAGMMLVVFAIADMLPSLGYIIAVVIGNIVVIALEALLVGIQVLRLEYYEMFSKFYIGDGKKYEPINVKNIKL